MSAAALELFLVLTLWTKPELAQATAVVEGFCGMGIQLRAGGFHTLMALLTATGWMAATVFCREYMIHVHKRNRFYLFWLMTLGATMGCSCPATCLPLSSFLRSCPLRPLCW